MTTIGQIAFAVALIIAAYAFARNLLDRSRARRLAFLRWQMERQQQMDESAIARLRECEAIWNLPVSEQAND